MYVATASTQSDQILLIRRCTNALKHLCVFGGAPRGGDWHWGINSELSFFSIVLGTVGSVRRAGRLGKCEIGDENRSHYGKKKNITTSMQQVQKIGMEKTDVKKHCSCHDASCSWCFSLSKLDCCSKRVETLVPLIGHRWLDGTVLLAQSPTNIMLILAHSKIF